MTKNKVLTWDIDKIHSIKPIILLNLYFNFSKNYMYPTKLTLNLNFIKKVKTSFNTKHNNRRFKGIEGCDIFFTKNNIVSYMKA